MLLLNKVNNKLIIEDILKYDECLMSLLRMFYGDYKTLEDYYKLITVSEKLIIPSKPWLTDYSSNINIEHHSIYNIMSQIEKYYADDYYIVSQLSKSADRKYRINLLLLDNRVNATILQTALRKHIIDNLLKEL